ncbi:MAG: hypothetical protein M1825_000306 [Sarcosagium campestre]|nr:MAG: hypothetical protein M1825_000306 [Sarcosagium campestre]
METPADADIKAAKVKKSLFKKPSWSTNVDTTVSQNGNLFNRSEDTYSDILKQQEEERRKKEARKERVKARRSSEDQEREGKRQRVLSGEPISISPQSITKPDRTPPLDKEAPLASTDLAQSLLSRSTPESRQETAEEVAVETGTFSRAPPITIPEGSEGLARVEVDKDAQVSNYVAPIAISTAREDEESASDEEFPELARKAREKARARRDEPKASLVAEPDPRSGSEHRISTSTPTTQISPPPRSASPLQPIVYIFITSSIDGTKPLIVSRRLNQRLKDVRVAWCIKQGFDEERTKSVFLTWRGKRLFDVTTCKRLGIVVDEFGEALVNGQSTLNSDGKIHMVATTEEIFAAEKKTRDSSFSEAAAEDAVEGDDDDAGLPAESPPEPGEEELRIVLKSPGLKDFTLTVKKSTTVSQAVAAYRKVRSLAPADTVYLVFDGDKLEPETEFGKIDVFDMDCIDVRIK